MARRKVDLPVGALAIGAVIGIVLTLGCGVLAHDLTRFTVAHLAAAYDQAGEEGTVTMTDLREITSTRGSTRLQCFGTFTPEDGGPVRTDVTTHVLDEECDIGRTEQARFVDGGGIAVDHGATAYVPGATPGRQYSQLYFVLLVPFGIVVVPLTLGSAALAFGFTRELLRALATRLSEGRPQRP
ncbi:hypothetical protein [Nocardiopsis suaedae]|uniref:DUF3592 domain-containing protein n=1 Tax=Nocardiopsis suaedae TaxID=3018444 RepID=A0ABT4TTH0_9ACTN|nr:hypothetical protein [Nocardiopsis suaedae]MDA2807990.1 hypothetical protein [Nocardiopsis suaedae]